MYKTIIRSDARRFCMRCVSLLLRWRHRENELEGVQSDLNRIDSRKRSVPSKALPFSQVQSVRLDWGSNLGATIKGLMIELKLDLNLNNQHGSLSQVHLSSCGCAENRAATCPGSSTDPPKLRFGRAVRQCRTLT